MYNDRIEKAQRVLRTFAGYAGPIDGQAGPATLAAALRLVDTLSAPALPARAAEVRVIYAAQVALRNAGYDAGKPDGFYGPQTDAAFEAWQAAARGKALPDRDAECHWGRQADVVRRFGAAGADICTAGVVTPPWRMVLAWDEAQVITRFRCHADVAPSAQRCFDRVGEVYSPADIHDLGLHLYGGCYQFRVKRGGTSLSMHAFGLAIDFDPARNRLTWGRDKARLAQPDAAAFWDIWEAEGWLSLGRARNYDWMHIQAPAL